MILVTRNLAPELLAARGYSPLREAPDRTGPGDSARRVVSSANGTWHAAHIFARDNSIKTGTENIVGRLAPFRTFRDLPPPRQKLLVDHWQRVDARLATRSDGWRLYNPALTEATHAQLLDKEFAREFGCHPDVAQVHYALRVKLATAASEPGTIDTTTWPIALTQSNLYYTWAEANPAEAPLNWSQFHDDMELIAASNPESLNYLARRWDYRNHRQAIPPADTANDIRWTAEQLRRWPDSIKIRGPFAAATQCGQPTQKNRIEKMLPHPQIAELHFYEDGAVGVVTQPAVEGAKASGIQRRRDKIVADIATASASQSYGRLQASKDSFSKALAVLMTHNPESIDWLGEKMQRLGKATYTQDVSHLRRALHGAARLIERKKDEMMLVGPAVAFYSINRHPNEAAGPSPFNKFFGRLSSPPAGLVIFDEEGGYLVVPRIRPEIRRLPNPVAVRTRPVMHAIGSQNGWGLPNGELRQSLETVQSRITVFFQRIDRTGNFRAAARRHGMTTLYYFCAIAGKNTMSERFLTDPFLDEAGLKAGDKEELRHLQALLWMAMMQPEAALRGPYFEPYSIFYYWRLRSDVNDYRIVEGTLVREKLFAGDYHRVETGWICIETEATLLKMALLSGVPEADRVQLATFVMRSCDRINRARLRFQSGPAITFPNRSWSIPFAERDTNWLQQQITGITQAAHENTGLTRTEWARRLGISENQVINAERDGLMNSAVQTAYKNFLAARDGARLQMLMPARRLAANPVSNQGALCEAGRRYRFARFMAPELTVVKLHERLATQFGIQVARISLNLMELGVEKMPDTILQAFCQIMVEAKIFQPDQARSFIRWVRDYHQAMGVG